MGFLFFADLSVFSDASGVWGCGAYFTANWFSLKWCSRLQPLPIAVKELIPVVLAAAIWETSGVVKQCYSEWITWR